MAYVCSYRLLPVMALMLGWVLLNTMAAWAIVGIEVGEREVARAPRKPNSRARAPNDGKPAGPARC